MKQADIQKLAEDLINSHEIIMKENENKKKEINKQIEKRTMQLFDHLFLNQVKLIEQNEKIENNLNLKSNQLINKLKQLIQQPTTETKIELNKQINEIKQELDNLHYNYYLEVDENLEDVFSIGQLTRIESLISVESNEDQSNDIHLISNDSNNSFNDKTDSDSDLELEINSSEKKKSDDLLFTNLASDQTQQISNALDISGLNLKKFFDLFKWQSLKFGAITKINLNEFKMEKKLLNDFVHKYIFDKYKLNTTANNLTKTNSGYTMLRYCHKYSSLGCKCKWAIGINIQDKSAHLDCKLMCSHIESSITSTKLKRSTQSVEKKLIKRGFCCGPLNTENWRNYENGLINKTNLNKEQFNELSKIENLFIDHIKSLGYEQRSGSWLKSKTGYTLSRLCNEMKNSSCQSKWFLKVNVPSVRADIYFFKRCSHVNL